MAKYKDREAKEAPYMVHNKDVESVCDGTFFIRGRNIHEECKNRSKCPKYAKFKGCAADAKRVGFYYVDTFRKCDLWKWQGMTEEYALQVAIYNMEYVNDIACACIIDMSDKVKDQDKETQKIFKACHKRCKKYERMFIRIIGDRGMDLCAEYNSSMDDAVLPLLSELRKKIQGYLEENNVENAYFASYAELAYIMVGYSIVSIDNRIRECKKYNKDVVALQSYKMTDMFRCVKGLCDWIGRKAQGLDLNKCPQIIEAYRNVDKALTDIRNIDQSMIKAKICYAE